MATVPEPDENEILPYQAHTLVTFLAKEPKQTLTRLYQAPSSCLAVFRILTPLERQIIMHLLWMESALPPSSLNAWVVRQHKKIYDEAIATLLKLNILTKPDKLSLNPEFKTNFRLTLTGSGTKGSFGQPLETGSPQDIEYLEGYALEKWESILHFMVSSGGNPISKYPKQLLYRSGLMTNPDLGTPRITSKGFQFLLHPPHMQLWQLLIQFIEMSTEDIVEVLSVILMISTTGLGREYTTQYFTEAQRNVLFQLSDYGLTVMDKKSSPSFTPTRLATTLTSSSPPLESSTTLSSGPKDGFIILETNYRMYAYTDNPLQTSVLNLFVSLKYRFPNLVVGLITRESVKRALNNGISAEQIITYLTTHAHPQMRKNNPLLPVTVQDQIRLWELEKNRLKSDEGYLYTDFSAQTDYELVLKYARELGVVLWENAAKRCFFAQADGHQTIRAYIDRMQASRQRAENEY
ncbi:transcription factor Tfb2 [Cylindrobasidium torrendii FP15055 ss-10]|uniref:RNA polymerase II transcription factor B subunit 2 n=1 Tax=Cylindrobasidium torrendii FP15055 ss-10 TaxID=1314674 RepID=A0A0D7BN95_9AGAR|nr:transcription factor Tfb2 [Cylindrobasidium torrendii FP15055 ss-10]